MPYCSKCGTESDEDAKFCPKCGTLAGPQVIEPETHKDNVYTSSKNVSSFRNLLKTEKERDLGSISGIEGFNSSPP